jgi:hypothetical protein
MVSIGIGQVLFLTFILAFYYPSTLSGAFEHWNSKPLITGFQSGDHAGNVAFSMHVLLAAVITAAGLAQVVPAIRQRYPAIHRWTGRTYIGVALALAIGGLWLVWVRGTYMNLVGATGISFNAAVIVGCAGMAWYYALQRDFGRHRAWALRLFVAASAVWFMRVGYMAWGIATGGIGIGERMDGLYDHFLAFGNTIVPLLVLEVYLRAAKAGNGTKLATAGLLTASALIVLGGSVGAWFMMWSPYL